MAMDDERGYDPQPSRYSPDATSFLSGAGMPRILRINLGVLDIPYANKAQPVRQAKKGKKTQPVKREPGTQTTGDVAEFLEEKYGVMATFAEVMAPGIDATIEEGLAQTLENLMAGAPAGNPFAQAQEDIEKMFKDFVATQEVEHAGIKGVPTQAALKGVNHRLKHAYVKRNPRRPSFIDTGLYVANFKAWID